MPKDTKYLFVTGGVISGLGKGVTAASMGLILKSAGFKISVIKADMYLNLDAGTMNPLEHGEVFVTDDGLETDQDLGHYERFLNQDFKRENYFTMGQIYANVLAKDRRLEYKGKCVEGHIHIPEEIMSRIQKTAEIDNPDVLIIEVGGTVGEYQNVLFFEAIRRLKQKYPHQAFLAHVVYLPTPSFLGEMKSKPAQESIYDLYRLGLYPDFVVCRSEKPIDDKRRSTIAFNTGVNVENIIANPDVDTIYRLPLILEEQHVGEKLIKVMNLEDKHVDLKEWKKLIANIDTAKDEVKIAIAGKYFTSGNFALEDAYVCVIEAIKHACWKLNKKPVIKWFDVERFEKPEELEGIKKEISECDGLIVPQGWGSRAVEGKIKAVEFAREKKMPYLGLCFGMQMAVIESARHLCGLKDANSTEVNPDTTNPVVHIMPNQREYLKKKEYGGTIRLGSWPCKLAKGTQMYDAYEKYGGFAGEEGLINERHRHRYEVNNEYRDQLSAKGMNFAGLSPDGELVEAIELDKKQHPFFLATQFHPEYKSRPLSPHPLFIAFIKASSK